MSMDDVELEKKLKSVGKAAFVNYYSLFENFASKKITRADAIEKLVSEHVSNEAGAAIRVGNAKLIFEHGRQRDALELIFQSNRIDSKLRKLAHQLKSPN